MHKLLGLLPIACGVAFGFQADRDKDVYDIYSVMLTDPKINHSDDARYLIGATTVPGTPRDPCVRPPDDRKAEFREVLADFENRKATPRGLRQDLSLPKAYILLTAADVTAFTQARDNFHPPPAVPDPRFEGVVHLFWLTDVYFNPSRRLALTAISSWCGNLCAQDQWMVFEKSDTGRWQELHWTVCTTVARR